MRGSGERRGIDEDEQHQERADDRCDTKTFWVGEQQHEHAAEERDNGARVEDARHEREVRDSGGARGDEEARRNKQAIEAAAAERIFGLLPADQRDQLMALWQEYETRTTPEGRFAYALDRLLPLTQNYHNGGQSWQENGVRAEQVRRINGAIAHGSQRLWSQAQAFIDDAVRQGFLPDTVSNPIVP